MGWPNPCPELYEHGTCCTLQEHVRYFCIHICGCFFPAGTVTWATHGVRPFLEAGRSTAWGAGDEAAVGARKAARPSPHRSSPQLPLGPCPLVCTAPPPQPTCTTTPAHIQHHPGQRPPPPWPTCSKCNTHSTRGRTAARTDLGAHGELVKAVLVHIQAHHMVRGAVHVHEGGGQRARLRGRAVEHGGDERGLACMGAGGRWGLIAACTHAAHRGAGRRAQVRSRSVLSMGGNERGLACMGAGGRWGLLAARAPRGCSMGGCWPSRPTAWPDC